MTTATGVSPRKIFANRTDEVLAHLKETGQFKKLQMIEAAETFLREEMGIRECRVRHHETLARVEVPPDCIPRLSRPENAARIDEHFRSLGYDYVALDLRGFRSGSLNEVISIP